MSELFIDLPEAINNTLEIAQRCSHRPNTKMPILPIFDKDLDKAVEWLKQTLADITDGKFPMSYFIITKSLRGYYKNPGSIAHKVLADRIGERDPGNKPKAGDRIPYVYHKVDEDPIYLGTYKNGKPKYKKS